MVSRRCQSTPFVRRGRLLCLEQSILPTIQTIAANTTDAKATLGAHVAYARLRVALVLARGV